MNCLSLQFRNLEEFLVRNPCEKSVRGCRLVFFFFARGRGHSRHMDNKRRFSDSTFLTITNSLSIEYVIMQKMRRFSHWILRSITRKNVSWEFTTKMTKRIYDMSELNDRKCEKLKIKAYTTRTKMIISARNPGKFRPAWLVIKYRLKSDWLTIIKTRDLPISI